MVSHCARNMPTKGAGCSQTLAWIDLPFNLVSINGLEMAA